jgi:hypothetical protein
LRYDFTVPAGWVRAPFPPPQRGIYLRAPVEKPGPESASILLCDPVVSAGSLEDQLAAFVKDACRGVKVVKQGKPARAGSRAFPGLAVTVQAQVAPAGGKAREEVRVFALLDGGTHRLPVGFVGGAKALAAHQGALDALLASIEPLVVGSVWVD